MITTEAYNKSLDAFKATVSEYNQRRKWTQEFYSLCMEILDVIDATSKTDENLRSLSYRYFSGEPKLSTIVLRDICKMAGYDYWGRTTGDLKIVNAINIIDTCSIYNRDPEQFEVNNYLDK